MEIPTITCSSHEISQFLRDLLSLFEGSELDSSLAEERSSANELIYEVLFVALKVLFLFLIGFLKLFMLQFSERTRHYIRSDVGHRSLLILSPIYATNLRIGNHLRGNTGKSIFFWEFTDLWVVGNHPFGSCVSFRSKLIFHNFGERVIFSSLVQSFLLDSEHWAGGDLHVAILASAVLW